MRIVQISGALAGAQKTIEENIHSFLSEKGHESRIFYMYGNSSMDCEVCYTNKFEDIFTRGVRKYISKNSHVSILQTMRLIKYIEEYNPDLVHLHVLHHGYVDYEMLFEYLAKKQYPIVYTMHDMWAITGGCYHYTTLNCDKFTNGCMKCESLHLDVDRKNTARELKIKQKLISKLNNLQIVTVSDWVKKELLKSYLASYPIHVIPNGAAMPHFDLDESKRHKNQDSKIYLISVAASWSKQKGIDIIFDLARMLDNRYVINLVGEASREIIELAPSNVHFYGYIKDKKELLMLYRDADLHFSASKEETFGMTFIESAIMGCRSVGFGCTAIEETLKKVNGVIVDIFSAEAFKEAIYRTIEQKMNHLSRLEVDEIKNSFSINKMAESYYQLYQTTLDCYPNNGG